MTDKDYITMNLEDALIERPCEFLVNDDRFFLHRPSLGKVVLISRLLSILSNSEQQIRSNPNSITIDAINRHREVILRVITLYTLRTKDQCFDSNLINDRCRYFGDNLDDKELLTLFTTAMSLDKCEDYLSSTGIDEDIRKKKIASEIKSKETKNILVFGGKTQFGSLVDFVCERYGWTYEYAVWGVSFTAIKMMASDAISSVYMSDKEMRKYKATGAGKGKGMNFSQFLHALDAAKING